MKHICIIANGYPTKDNPEYAFIRPVAHGFADHGIKCTVIAPQSITRILLKKRVSRPSVWEDKTALGNSVKIIQPKVVSFSNIKILGTSISAIINDLAVKLSIKKYNVEPDVFYGHFWECGITAAKISQSKPVFVACGESKIGVYNRYRRSSIDILLPKIKGVICVSSKNRDECESLGLFKYDTRSIVLPNGIDVNEFYYIPQKDARCKLGFDENDVIAIFVGAFIERKGVLRLVEAAKRIPELKLLLIGKGEQEPKSDQIIFSGRLAHEEIVTYLNAADMFVLPTLAEGCCNAIVEAMACGLPIISSKLPFNEDILDDNNSILINPNNIDEIGDALIRLAGDKHLREEMRKDSLKKAKKLSINNRVNEIISFVFEKQMY